jgi:hypothetical protein
MLAGWCIGKLDINRILQYTTDSYINRYNTMSGAKITEVTYYLVSDSIDSVKPQALEIPGVLGIDKSGIDSLYDIRVAYEARRNSVSALRSLADVSAVFTVPLLCH